MKRIFVLFVLIGGVFAYAEEKEELRGQKDFSQDYLEQVKSEKQSEESREKLRKDHDKFLRDIANTDRMVRGR